VSVGLFFVEALEEFFVDGIEEVLFFSVAALEFRRLLDCDVEAI
jgi:hypothetical protein